MAMSKSGKTDEDIPKGQKAFGTGYIAPTMEVINKKVHYLGGVMDATTDAYSWVEYEKEENIIERNGKKLKQIKLGDINAETQKLEGGFFLFRDSRTDKAYVIDKEGKVKKV